MVSDGVVALVSSPSLSSGFGGVSELGFMLVGCGCTEVLSGSGLGSGGVAAVLLLADAALTLLRRWKVGGLSSSGGQVMQKLHCQLVRGLAGDFRRGFDGSVPFAQVHCAFCSSFSIVATWAQ